MLKQCHRDVTHPGPGALLGTPSIAAIVGSVDQHGGKFLGSMRLQPRDSACEDIKDVKGMVSERIRAWFIHFKKLPANILYYRDGVSDSLPQIRAAFKEAAKTCNVMNNKFKLTAVVVAKRHHVRFMPGTDDPNYAKLDPRKEANGNCKPGTLVDTVVTSPYFSDFYLQSHDGIKGTAIPAHYFQLVNEMGLKDTDLQELASDCATLAGFPGPIITFKDNTVNVESRPTSSATPMSAPREQCLTLHPHTTLTDSASVAGTSPTHPT
ncbi:hypothetical protein IAQ61_007696 [Plenodomus lingam]|uniref:uncharacterized protein n=1 Tax=Leptosphaeria maculans TaxID=5022 RepID=UPI00331C07E0|nr:hypothetical protein IAQ61_007696 [Plenodomus lingam]